MNGRYITNLFCSILLHLQATVVSLHNSAVTICMLIIIASNVISYKVTVYSARVVATMFKLDDLPKLASSKISLSFMDL